MLRRYLHIASAFAVGVAFVVAGQTASAAVQASCDTRVNNTHQKLLECVTLEGVRAHQAAFQAIADANDGVRAVGTPGYDRSLEYVEGRLLAAGYNVTRNPFPFTYVAVPDTAPAHTRGRHLRDRGVHGHRDPGTSPPR